ncbi:MAG: hypothetical protein AAFP17_17990 [Pseudomonadota bacterium]
MTKRQGVAGAVDGGGAGAEPLTPGLAALAAGRVHEACGAGRLAFALALAGEGRGPVLWIADATRRDRPCPAGIARFFDPARLVLARPTGLVAALQVMEETLRSGAAPLVVAELEAAPDLTQSRRLQLAAGTGGGHGLCLVPENRLATNAAETRWRCRPLAAPLPDNAASAAAGSKIGGGGIADGTQARHGPTGALQLWELVKNKRGPLGAWEVSLDTHAGGDRRPDTPPHSTARRAQAAGWRTHHGGSTAIGGIRAVPVSA